MNRQKSLTSNNNGDDNGNKKYSVIEMKVNRSNNNSDSSSRRRNNISIKATVLSTYLYRVHSIHWKNIIYYLFVSECVSNEYTYTARKTYPFFRGFLCVCLRVRDLMCCDVFSPSVPLLIFDFSDVCFCLRCSPYERNKEEKNTNRSASHKHSICKHESRRERNEMNWMELDGLI